MAAEVDLALAPDEEEVLRLLEAVILQKTLESRRRAAEVLAQHLTVGFYRGAERALKDTGAAVRAPEVNVRALDRLVSGEVAPALEDAYRFIARDLTDVINEGIGQRLTYAEIRSNLAQQLEETFGREIAFDRVGQLKEVVHVSPSGRMRLVKEEITRPYTASVENYAGMLSRTSTHKAYALGHVEGFKAAGLQKWRYLSARDERTRPHHLALHGHVFVVGSTDEELALRVMGEPNCRCRPVAFFDDPKLDKSEGAYAEQKREWARDKLEEEGLGEEERAFLHSIARA